ncbi:methyltransferase domain-containing protein [Actinomadura viridis]|uniref:methyltransferase domain-containing protein n=1 Tax=Actinomadura viridis TaxID=58110 RepID=UPI0036BB8E49
MAEYSLALSEAEVARYRQMAEAALRDERALWDAAGVRPGARIADVGCGPGAISIVLARIVGSRGYVQGVDRDLAAVSTARRLAARVGLTNVRFRQGDADATGLDPGSMDVVMMRHVLAHNGGHEQAIVGHLASLARPGGCVYLVDVDVEGMRSEPVIPVLEDLNAAYRALHARRGNDLSVGLRLGELLAGAGLEAVEVHDRPQVVTSAPGLRPPAWAARELLVAEGLVTRERIEEWGAAFERLDREGPRFDLFLSQYCALGRRPAE